MIIFPVVKGFHNETSLLDDFNQNDDDRIVLGLVFYKLSQTSLNYDIRIFNKGIQWYTNSLYQAQYKQGKGSIVYTENGFIPLQMAVGFAYANFTKTILPKIEFEEFPYPPHWENEMILYIHTQMLPLLTLFGFITTFPSLLKLMAEEIASKVPVSSFIPI